MASLIRPRRNPQRKYIDLINEASCKWANWDPQRRIKVCSPLPIHLSLTDLLILQQPGDFGTVIKSTGEFVVEGNIYEHEDLAHIAKNYPPCEGHETDLYHIHSYEVRGVNVGAGFAA